MLVFRFIIAVAASRCSCIAGISRISAASISHSRIAAHERIAADGRIAAISHHRIAPADGRIPTVAIARSVSAESISSSSTSARAK